MLKQVIVVRKDLKIGKGKLAVEVAHAAVTGAEISPWSEKWKEEGQKKVVLYVKNLNEMLSLYKKAKKARLPTGIIEDAGLTQVKKGTKTALFIGPAPEKEIDKITKDLPLL